MQRSVPYPLVATLEQGAAVDVDQVDELVTYLVGVNHNLVGAGSVAIAQPVGLRLTLAGIPAASVNRRARVPVEYFGIGDLAVGSADGWAQRVPLRFAQQIVYPLPDSMTVLAYDLVAGLTVQATELVAPAPSVALTEVWQRNPAPVGTSYVAWNPGNSPLTTFFTYTVPAGRRLLLASARVQLIRLGTPPAASASTANCTFTIDNVGAVAIAYLSGPTLFVYDQMVGPVWLAAGQSFRATYINQEAAGGSYAVSSWAGTLQDA